MQTKPQVEETLDVVAVRMLKRTVIWLTLVVWIVGLSFGVGWGIKMEASGESKKLQLQEHLDLLREQATLKVAYAALSANNEDLSANLEAAKQGLLFRDFLYR